MHSHVGRGEGPNEVAMPSENDLIPKIQKLWREGGSGRRRLCFDTLYPGEMQGFPILNSLQNWSTVHTVKGTQLQGFLHTKRCSNLDFCCYEWELFSVSDDCLLPAYPCLTAGV